MYNYFIVLRTKGALVLSEYQRGRIAGQFESGLSQRKISNLSIPVAAVNRVIVKCTRPGP